MITRLSQRLAALLFVIVMASPAWTQPQNPYVQIGPRMPQPTAQTQATSNVVAPPPQQVQVVNQNGYAPAYPPGYYPPYNPYGGYLSGKADLVTARAQRKVTNQQAMLLNQQVGIELHLNIARR